MNDQLTDKIAQEIQALHATLSELKSGQLAPQSGTTEWDVKWKL